MLSGNDLESLPDDPDELREALLALAGPSAGPGGGEFYVDGFRGGTLPSRSTIQEIRINQNPFAAEFNRFGRGRIEIITRPGTDRFQGWVSARFNDESFNSRDPFALDRAPFQMRQYLVTLSGPLVRRASFFLHIDHRDTDDNAVISANVLDENLREQPFSQVVLAPQRRTVVSPRFAYQFNANNTLSVRYLYMPSTRRKEGVGDFSLAPRAYDAFRRDHELAVTETAILGPRLINEVGFRYERSRNRREGDNSVPTLRVLEAFTGGGSQVGLSSSRNDRWELKDSISAIVGRHTLRTGGSWRYLRLFDVQRSNYGGTFTFGGGIGPQLDADNRVVLGPTGQPLLVPISSLERYRRTLLFQRQGKTVQEIRALGGGATQFSIVAGDPQARVGQWEAGFFAQDDWRVRNDFVLSLGLRYEAQSNIADQLDLAPRVAFAWSPGSSPGAAPKTVIRGGFGIFYDRFSEAYTLEALRLDGSRQAQFIVSEPDFFPNIPAISDLRTALQTQTVRRVAGDLRSPYSMQSAISVERQLPFGFRLAASYIRTRGLHLLYSRNAGLLSGRSQGSEPGNIFEYNSGGILDQNQLVLGVGNRMGRTGNFTASYVLSKADSNTDGARSFPSNGYDLAGDYGRASFDVRHYFTFVGAIGAPWGLQLNPFLVASSSRPFNITLGRDVNGDTVFTEHPALASDAAKPGVVVTESGIFDPSPAPGQPVIPRNFGKGPGFVLLNFNVSKTFRLSRSRSERNPRGGASPVGASPQDQGGGPVPGAPAPQAGGMGGMGGGPASSRSLTFSLQVLNILNHVNFGPVVGNLTSPLYGRSNSTATGFGFGPAGGGPMGPQAAGNRRIQLMLRYNF